MSDFLPLSRVKYLTFFHFFRLREIKDNSETESKTNRILAIFSHAFICNNRPLARYASLMLVHVGPEWSSLPKSYQISISSTAWENLVAFLNARRAFIAKTIATSAVFFPDGDCCSQEFCYAALKHIHTSPWMPWYGPKSAMCGNLKHRNQRCWRNVEKNRLAGSDAWKDLPDDLYMVAR